MPTLRIDLELPEAEYQYASALTQAERRRVASIGATAAFATARNVPAEEGEEPHDNTPFTKEEIDALSDAVAQQDAGLASDGDAFFARLYKEHGWSLKP